MTTKIHRLFFILMMTLLGGCGEVKRINPPLASIQQLSVMPNGQWQLELRIQNFSNVTMHYTGLTAQLELEKILVGVIETSLNIDIPGESAEVITVSLTPPKEAQSLLDSTKNQQSNEIGILYSLQGSIRSNDTKNQYSFERQSRLNPVPGLPNVYR